MTVYINDRYNCSARFSRYSEHVWIHLALGKGGEASM